MYYNHINSYLLYIKLLILSLATISICYAGDYESISKKDLPLSLSDKIFLVRDSSHIKNYSDVIKLPDSSFITPEKNKNLSKSFSIKMKWGKILLNLNKNLTESLIISHLDQVDYIEYFVLDHKMNLVSSGKNGTSVELNDRSMYMGNSGVKLTMPLQKNITIIFKYKSFYVSSFNLRLKNYNQYEYTTGIQIIVWALYLGLALGMIIYNFFLYVSTRNMTYFYYSFVTAFFTININSNFHSFKGFQSELFGHSLDKFAYSGNGISTFFFVAFIVHLLDFEVYYPKVRKNLIRANYATAIIYLLPIFFEEYFSILQEIQSLLLAQLLMICLGIAINLYIKFRQTHVKLSILAFSAFAAAGALAHADMALGFDLPSNILAYSILIGSAIQLILMSIAMTFKVKVLREQMAVKYKRNKEELEVLFQKKKVMLAEVNENLRKFSKNGQIGELSNQVISEILTPLNKLQALGSNCLNNQSVYDDEEILKLNKAHLRIEEALKRISLIASKTLLLSPKETFRVEEKNEYILSDLISDLIDKDFKKVLNAKSIMIKTPMLLSIKVHYNKEALSKSIKNLVQNSIDALTAVDDRELKKHISISCYQEKDQIIISIVDNAEGIKEAILSEALLPFYSTRSFSGNLGLGLSISSSLLSMIGGKIKFKPTTNRERYSTYISLNIESSNKTIKEDIFLENEAA